MEAAQLGGQGSILRLQRLDLVLNRHTTQSGLHEEGAERVITSIFGYGSDQAFQVNSDTDAAPDPDPGF
jgi:hypothetical protein